MGFRVLGTTHRTDMRPTRRSSSLGVLTATDPYLASVVSLLNFGGAAGSTTITDHTGKTWTPQGNAQIDTTFGQSLLLDGAGDYATTPDHAGFAFGGGEFTVEGYFRESVRGAIRQVIGQHSTNGADVGNNSFLILSDNGYLKFQVFMGSSGYTAANAAQHALDTTIHFAAVRDSGNVFRLYLDGTQVASVTQSGALTDSSRGVTIGAVMDGNYPHAGGYYFNGRIMPLRITNGACRYPGGTPFTPPTAPFPTI